MALRAPRPREPCPAYGGQLATPRPSALRAPASQLPPRLWEAECSRSSGRPGGRCPLPRPSSFSMSGARVWAGASPGRAPGGSAGGHRCPFWSLLVPGLWPRQPSRSILWSLPVSSHSRDRAIGLGPTRSRTTSPEPHLPRPYFQTRCCGRELECPCSVWSSRTCPWSPTALARPQEPTALFTGLTLGSRGPRDLGTGHWIELGLLGGCRLQKGHSEPQFCAPNTRDIPAHSGALCSSLLGAPS